jgi:hypothetical protein
VGGVEVEQKVAGRSSVRIGGRSGWSRSGTGGGKWSPVRIRGTSGWSRSGTEGGRQVFSENRRKEWVEQEWKR